jgi:hypothetical protein
MLPALPWKNMTRPRASPALAGRNMPAVERLAVRVRSFSEVYSKSDARRDGLNSHGPSRAGIRARIAEKDDGGQPEVDQQRDLDCRPEHHLRSLSLKTKSLIGGRHSWVAHDVAGYSSRKKSRTGFPVRPCFVEQFST